MLKFLELLDFAGALVGVAALGCFVASFVCPFSLDRKRLSKCPGKYPYKWGYYTGLSLFSAPVWLLGLTGQGPGSCVPALVLATVYWPTGIFVLKRRKWAAIAGTVLALNPIVWLVNAIYFSRRWKEFTAESRARAGVRAPEASPPNAVHEPVAEATVSSQHAATATPTRKDWLGYLETGVFGILVTVFVIAPVAGLMFLAIANLRSTRSPSNAPELPRPPSVAAVKPAQQQEAEYSRQAVAPPPALGPAGVLPTTAGPQTVRGQDLGYTLRLPGGWTAKKHIEGLGDYDMVCVYKSLYIGVVAEEAQVGTPETLARLARDRLKNNTTDLYWSEPQPLVLDGRNWLGFVAKCKTQEIPAAYQFYVYSGPEGSFQLLGWTMQNLWDRDADGLREVMRTFRFPISAQ